MQADFEANPVCCLVGTRCASSMQKVAKYEFDHFPPFNAEVYNTWTFTSTPLYLSYGLAPLEL